MYEESESYHFWAGRESHNISVKSGGETYGIDINQGFVALQYGLGHRWAADLNFGGTTGLGDISMMEGFNPRPA